MEKKRRHLLLEKARTYSKFTHDPSPPDCQYNIVIGAWILQDGRGLYVNTPERKGPKTKKCDIETGEDQKSE